MNVKYVGLFSIITVISVAGVLFGISMDETKNNTQSVQELTSPVYIPSDITKANPNFVVEHGESLWVTTNIADVKDQVVYTLQGTVLSIGDPIEWKTGIFSEYGEGDDYYQVEGIIGFIPITISVDNIYKGKLTDNEFTFYVGSHKYNDRYTLSPDTDHYEIGENILIHLGYSDHALFPDGYYGSVLAGFSKYQLQPVVGTFAANDNTTDIEYTAFNVHHPNGIPLDQVGRLALP